MAGFNCILLRFNIFLVKSSGVENTCSNTKVARFSQNLRIILSYPLAGLFEYCFGCTDIFWPNRSQI